MTLKECYWDGTKYQHAMLAFNRVIPAGYVPKKGATYSLSDLILTVNMVRCPVPKRFRVGSADGIMQICSLQGKLYFELKIEAETIADAIRCYDMMLEDLGSVIVTASAIEELTIAAGHLVSETVAVVTDTITGAISSLFGFIGIHRPEEQTT